MRRGLKLSSLLAPLISALPAARAAPYEKGTETCQSVALAGVQLAAARAAPYEKGTETESG